MALISISVFFFEPTNQQERQKEMVESQTSREDNLILSRNGAAIIILGKIMVILIEILRSQWSRKEGSQPKKMDYQKQKYIS